VKGRESSSVYPPNAQIYGASYPEWTAKWWQWFISIPDPGHPIHDPTGANCATSQSGPVWFLAGSDVGNPVRTCTVPMGKAILLPTINNECSTAEYKDLTTESALRDCVKSFASHFKNFEATIDGTPIENITLYNIVSPLFNATFPAKPVFTAAPGPTQAVSAGNWVFIAPLPEGTHEIHIKGASVDFTGDQTTNYAQDVTYHLMVK